ncbi:DUF1461 domain-containing protein, partial [Candidatus Woesearchaeota archaeon]|nr:DUF1461 domain-containing protein [Candidatus Woesearchaeota archaeon]
GLFYYFYKKEKILIMKGLFYGGILTLLILAIGVIMFLVNFDFAFSLFHHIFFPQGNYVFRTNLPVLYNGFWYFSISLRIVVYSALVAGVLVVQNWIKRK